MVSIIIPVYNVQDYIIKCLESVANQTYSGDIECLIIDDCGQDNSINLAEEYIASYKGKNSFRIIHHGHNRGLSAARNTGIRESKGEWIYFLDGDDWIILECIQLMMECVSKHSDTDIVFAGADVTTKEHGWLDYSKKKLPDYSNDSLWLQSSMLQRYSFGMTAWNKLISRDFIISNNLFFDEGYIHEDELWNFRASSFIYAASFLRKNTYTYVVRDNSISNDVNPNLYWNRHFDLWNKMITNISGRNVHMQVAGLSQFIIEKTRRYYPSNKKWELFRLYYLLALKSFSASSFLFLLQGLLAVIGKGYNNYAIIKRIALS